MGKKRAAAGMLALALAFMLILPSCATQAASGMFGPGNFYSDTVAVGVKKGEASGTIVLGIFGSGYPSVEKVA
jgi:hypothetical protein